MNNIVDTTKYLWKESDGADNFISSVLSIQEKKMSSALLSVGIDIGTSTTGMVVSSLEFSNTAMSYMVPKIDIIDKKIIYKSRIYNTPVIDSIHLDDEAIKRIIKDEYKNAGITPQQVDSGAVIITGESALKENADSISRSLSEFAGEFVVATAGPDLESIIAGKGSGAQSYSKEHSCTVINFDIGGGTTNISAFYCGELEGRCCFDIGGRLIKYGDDKAITYVSPRINDLAELDGFRVEPGMKVTEHRLRKMTDLMAGVLEHFLNDKQNGKTELMRTKNSSHFANKRSRTVLSFSGGVADFIYEKENDVYKYNDLGVSLAESIRNNDTFKNYQIIDSKETIRATVVGAGIYTTVVSGSTINYSRDLFPIKSIPAFLVSKEAEENVYLGDERKLTDEFKWFMNQINDQKAIMCFKGKKRVSYEELCNMAKSIAQVSNEILHEETPLLVITENDMAKSLGQTIERYIEGEKDIVCIDKIECGEGDYIDVGKPLMNGMALPIVVKTLIFK